MAGGWVLFWTLIAYHLCCYPASTAHPLRHASSPYCPTQRKHIKNHILIRLPGSHSHSVCQNGLVWAPACDPPRPIACQGGRRGSECTSLLHSWPRTHLHMSISHTHTHTAHPNFTCTAYAQIVWALHSLIPRPLNFFFTPALYQGRGEEGLGTRLGSSNTKLLQEICLCSYNFTHRWYLNFCWHQILWVCSRRWCVLWAVSWRPRWGEDAGIKPPPTGSASRVKETRLSLLGWATAVVLQWAPSNLDLLNVATSVFRPLQKDKKIQYKFPPEMYPPL